MIPSLKKPDQTSPLLELSLLRARKNLIDARSFQRGERLPSLSESWVIQSGVVRTLTWDMDGNVAVLGWWGTGDLIYQVPRKTEPHQYECLTPTVLTKLYDFHGLPDLLLKQFLKMEELLALSHCRNTSDRLLKMLHWLADHFGQPCCDRSVLGRLIDIQITHQQLADLAGTTRVTVTRCLGQFERDYQIVRLRRGRFFIPME
jgi:CRP-like cAMP-binding protein